MALPKLYELITWINGTTPALNEDNLNAMSQAIDDIDDRVIDLAGTIMEDVPQIQEDMEILGPAVENIDANVARAEAAAESAEQYAEEIAPPIEVVKDYADIITIEDAINKAAKDVKVKVDAVQDLHGYTKPWVGGAGKNLLPMTVAGIKAANTTGTWSGNTYTINGVAFTIVTDADNNVIGIKAHGTASGGNATFAIMPNASNIFNSMIINGGVSASCRIQFFDQTAASQVNATGGDVTIAFNNGDTCRVSAIVNDGSTANNAILYPMIRKSTDSASFEPYTNICPITGHSEAKVTRTGKNVLSLSFNGTTTGSGITFTDNHDGTITASGTATADCVFYVAMAADNYKIPAGKYIASKGNSLSDLQIVISGYKGTTWVTNLIAHTDEEGAIEVTYNNYDRLTFYLKIPSGTVLSSSITIKPMIRPIEFSDSTWEPYKGELFTIDLDGTRYGGVLDVDTGTLTLTHAYIEYDGSEEWFIDGVRLARYTQGLPGVKPPVNNSTVADIKSNLYEAKSSNDTYSRVTGISVQATQGYLYIYDSRFTTNADLSNWATFLQSNHLQIVYELTTPQTITLTAEEVTLLWAYNTLFADTGDIALTYDASGVLRIANAKLDIDTFKSIVAASSDFADFKSRVAAL